MHNKYINRFTNSLDAKNISVMPSINIHDNNSYNTNSPKYQYPNQHYNNNPNSQYHISMNEYKNANPNLYSSMSPRNNQGYNMNNGNFNQLNSSGEKLRMVANNLMN